MFPIPDALAGFYLICFGVGFLFVFASLFLGITHDTLDLPGIDHGDGGHGDLGGLDGLGHHGPAFNGHAGEVPTGEPPTSHHHTGGVSPINMSTIMAFLTWFGGAGYILRVYSGMLGVVSLVAACLAGLAGGALIFFFLARVLYPGQRFLNSADYRMEGTVAQVTVSIRPDVAGEVVYSKGGSRRSDGAVSATGKAIERGTEVVIVRYDRGIAYVEPWDSFVREA